MILTVASDMTPPVWSATVPIMRPKLPWENSGTENSNTPRVAPSTPTHFLARTSCNVTDFMEHPPFLKAEDTETPTARPREGPTHLPLNLLKGPPTLGGVYHHATI